MIENIVSHSVGLVEYKKQHLREIDHFHLQEIVQSPRSGDQYLHARLKFANLNTLRTASVGAGRANI